MELSVSQCELAHRSELSDRDEMISRLKADVRIMEERLGQGQQQIIQREDQISRAQSEVRLAQDETTQRERSMQKLEVDLNNAQEEHRVAVDEVGVIPCIINFCQNTVLLVFYCDLHPSALYHVCYVIYPTM